MNDFRVIKIKHEMGHGDYDLEFTKTLRMFNIKWPSPPWGLRKRFVNHISKEGLA